MLSGYKKYILIESGYKINFRFCHDNLDRVTISEFHVIGLRFVNIHVIGLQTRLFKIESVYDLVSRVTI